MENLFNYQFSGAGENDPCSFYRASAKVTYEESQEFCEI
jgi:hypothetical protein